jgi:dTDP-4-amino-4,6-dideoxygalactose transaminase
VNEPGGKKRIFLKDLSEPVSVPPSAIERAMEIMHSGRVFRYGEFKGGGSEVAALERDFAAYLGVRYAVAMNSCGSTLFLALKCSGVKPGDPVLMNAYTLAPVPGAIEHAGARPLYVQCTNDYCVDLEDLEEKARLGAKVFLMSHMRGHIADMDAVSDICKRYNIRLIEDCAHTLGASWDGRASGTFGDIACYSLQTFKHINAGEGGILATHDEDVAARAILHSGSYMLYAQNGTPPDEAVFERHKYNSANFSMRMNELTAALARPQIDLLEQRAELWRERYRWLEERFVTIPHVKLPHRPAKEQHVPSSIQFSLVGLAAECIAAVLASCKERGVDIKWFGKSTPEAFTSTWKHWRYVQQEQDLPETGHMLAGLCDMRIPLSLTLEDCQLIADILAESIALTKS